MAGKRKISAKSENDASAVTIAAPTEESFPRGGASALTPLEHREISNKVAKDLFVSSKASEATATADNDEEPSKKKRKPSKKTKKTIAVKDEKLKSEKTYIEQLNFKKLTVGIAFLGCISHINELDLFVSLPHQLVGIVPITEISDAITAIVEKVANEDEDEDMEEDESAATALPNLADLFYVGQWIRCKITSIQTDGKKVIELSLKPNVVNEDIVKVDITPGVTLGATVKSVEDHGYILDLGVKDLAGFLPLKESKSYIKHYNRNEELAVGQYVECAVEKTDARIANVTIDRTKIGHAVVEDPFSRITSVLPGQLITGVIDAVQGNGLGLQMQGLYPATIDQSHIPASQDIEKEYKLGQKISFRTLFTILNTEEKKIGGSVLAHALDLGVPTIPGADNKFVTQVFPTGSFLEKVRVARVNNTGVWVTLDGVSGVCGYVHVSRLADEHIATVSDTSGKFKIGSTHRARVLTYNPVDAVLILTLQPSVLAEKFLRVADIEIGSMVECEVEKLIPAGIIVKVSKSISGLVPTMHMADVKLTRPEFKFKVGKKIQCRVFKVDLMKQKVFLTLKKSLINSEYPIFKDINDVNIDDVSHGVIVAIKHNGCVVSYYNNLTAFAPGSEMTETRVADLSEIFHVGQTVKTTVVKVDPEENKMLVSFINSKKKAEKKAETKAKLDAKHEAKNDALAPGKIVTATIKSIKKNHLTLSLPSEQLEGRVHVSEVYNSFDEIKNPKAPLSQFRSKQEIQVKILGVRNIKLNTYLPITHAGKVKQHVDCSLRLESNEDDESAREIRNIKAGDAFIGFISDIHPAYVRVSVGSHTTGTMQKQLASFDPNVCNNLTKHFVSGQAIRAVALSVDANKNTIEFMNAEDPKAPVITDISDIKEGQIMNAVIKYTNKVNGVSVNITSKIAGKAYLTDIADTYSEDPTASCTENQVVRIAIIGVNKERAQVDVSMRPSRIYPDIESNEIKSFEDIKRGQVYEGYVSNIAAMGVFVKLNHSIAARVKIANLSDSFVKEWKTIYKLGQLVKAKIIYIDYDMKRLEASLKKSVVEGSLATALKSSKAEQQQQVEDSDSDEEMPEVDDSDQDMADATSDDDDDDDAGEQAKQMDSDQEQDEEESASAPALNIDSFDWTGINNRVDSSDEEEESDDEDQDDKTKDKKKKKEEVQDLTAELNTNTPQTAGDFERLLVGSPNSSYLWINFMAYQLQLSEIAKARDIGERALKTISFREEQEKMNVWVALLNLENNFGTDETLQEVFKRALVYCEPLKVYLQLVKIYERSDKQAKAEALWEEMTKKFGSQSPEVWSGYAVYCLEQRNKPDQARALLEKSLKVLPKHEHVHMIVKFAQLEFKHGEAERGRTILEGVMSNYPKRLDLWNIYIDMEIKAGDTEMTRRLFERVASMKFSSKKMKFLFKKWIQFEKTHGTEDDVQRVKEKTLAYVESMS